MSETRQRAPQDAVAGGLYTETLARIYWRQGLLSEALQIYRRLAEDYPDEPRLQAQIRTLTQALTTAAPVQAASPQTEVQALAPHTPPDWRAQALDTLERWLACLQQQQRQ
jgi:hypothetical protein